MEYYDSNDSQYNQPSSQDQNGASANRPNTMAVVSMLCGISGTVLLCCCILFPVSILLGVAAIVLSILSKKGAAVQRLCHCRFDSWNSLHRFGSCGICLSDVCQHDSSGSGVCSPV